jgi:hypothetical protein
MGVLTMGRGEVTERTDPARFLSVLRRTVEVPILAPEELVLVAACSAHPETPQHWFTAERLAAKAGLDWDYLVDQARRLAPLRVASLLLYCRSDDVPVPDGIVASLLPS